MSISIGLKVRHPRTGGDPCLLIQFACSLAMDSRLRGNDGVRKATV
jgi:hypothetical protein